jgi:putative oxidoreductase
MFSKLVRTREDWTLTFLRLVLGAIFFAHGAQKALGWFAGPGYAGAMAMFHQMGIPGPFGLLAVAAEFLGSLALFCGLLGRLAGVAIAVDMVVAVLLVHLPNGFFMNWSGTQAGEGFEYHLLAIGIAVTIAVKGSGAWSIDRQFLRSGTRGDAEATADRRSAR